MCCDEELSGGCCGGEESCNAVCKCCPYKSSPMLITAQCLSIFATILSFTWWVTFFLSLPSFIVLQIVWCCKLSKAGVIAVGVMSTLTFSLSIFAGNWIQSNWIDYEHCPVWVLFNYGDEYDHHDDVRMLETDPYDLYCHEEEGWAILAFFDAALWGIISTFIFTVICTGKLDKMRNGQSTNQDAQVVGMEMGRVATAVPHAAVLPSQESPYGKGPVYTSASYSK